MNIIAETHLHVYPCYDVKKVFHVLRSNLQSHGPDNVHMAFLTERSDCHFFIELKENKSLASDGDIHIKDFGNALLISESGYDDFYLFSGRQIITKEKLEVLALTTDINIPDNELDAADVIRKINDDNGVAVISWAPGKWLGSRGKLIGTLLEHFSPSSLLLADTAIRPRCFFEPLLMKQAQKKGYNILAGSDPLPFEGEEIMAGRYVTRWMMDFNPQDPLDSVRKYLKNPSTNFERAGKRNLLFETLIRYYRNFQTG